MHGRVFSPPAVRSEAPTRLVRYFRRENECHTWLAGDRHRILRASNRQLRATGRFVVSIFLGSDHVYGGWRVWRDVLAAGLGACVNGSSSDATPQTAGAPAAPVISTTERTITPAPSSLPPARACSRPASGSPRRYTQDAPPARRSLGRPWTGHGCCGIRVRPRPSPERQPGA